MSWVLCSVCHRVLLVEHGPTCPDCLIKQALATVAEVVEAPLSHQPMARALHCVAVAKPKRKDEDGGE